MTNLANRPLGQRQIDDQPLILITVSSVQGTSAGDARPKCQRTMRRASTTACWPGERAGQNQGKPARQRLLKKPHQRPRSVLRGPAILRLAIIRRRPRSLRPIVSCLVRPNEIVTSARRPRYLTAVPRGNVRSRASLQGNPDARVGMNAGPHTRAPVLLAAAGGAGNP